MPPKSPSKNLRPMGKKHPCFGVVGIDPRFSTQEHGQTLNNRLVNALAGWVNNGTLHTEW